MRRHGKADEYLKAGFGRFGKFVAVHRHWFVVVPVVLSLLLGMGMLGVEYSSDPDHLLTPVDGEGRREKAVAEKFFPTNFSNFDASRSIKFGYYGYVMVTGKDGRSVLNPEAWTEVRSIQEEILRLEVELDGRKYKYQDICARWNGECYTNSLLSVADTFSVLSRGIFREPVKNYYENFTGYFSPGSSTNLSELTPGHPRGFLATGMEELELIANQTLDDISTSVLQINKAVNDLEKLTVDLYERYRIQLKPSLEAINLPAYFGGITLKDEKLNSVDVCEFLALLRSDPMEGSTCADPVEMLNAIGDLLGQVEQVEVTKSLLRRLRTRIRAAVHSLNIRASAERLISILKNINSSLQQFKTRVEETVGGADDLRIEQLVAAEAILIGGLLDSDSFPEVSDLWERKFLHMIENMSLNWTVANPLISNSLKLEMIKGVERIKPILIANITAMILFSMSVCFTKDIVTSKPWIGLAGVVSTVLATFAGFGLLVFLGAEFTNFNYGAVFIMIGIGLDDTFVVLNSWGRTDRSLDVPLRMQSTMSEAGVSILITSLTDLLCFYSAILVPYPYVKIFCLYSGTCIIFLFLFQITFFTGCLALSGYHEAEERSGLTLAVVDPKERYRECLCLRFGAYQVNFPETQDTSRREQLAVQASRIIGRFIRSKTTRVTLLFVYIVYVYVCVYGILNIQVYFDRTKLINYDSSMTDFVELEDRLFRDKSFSISVIVSGELNYSDPYTIQRIEMLLEELEASPHVNRHLTKSWIHHFQTVSSAKEFLLNQTQVFETEEEFVAAVSKFYRASGNPYTLDIRYNEDRTRILASRFLVQGQNIHSTTDEEAMVTQIRDICRRFSHHGMEATVFNSYFIYIDQYLSIFNQTLQCIFTTGAIVVLVSLILLPDTLAALTSIVSIVSTLVGTLGLMSIWGIALDGISLINLVMCIGFSVDFSAHFSYHYIDIMCKEENSNVVDKSLVSVIKPIFQAGVSTVLGLVGLLFAPSTGFVIFFKMVFIVISLGVVHSLVLLPCLLQFFIDLKGWIRSKENNGQPTLVCVSQIVYDNHGYV